MSKAYKITDINKNMCYRTPGNAKIQWKNDCIAVYDSENNKWKVFGIPVKIKDGTGKTEALKSKNALFRLNDDSKLLIMTDGHIKRVKLFHPRTPLCKDTLQGIDPCDTTVYINDGYKKIAGPPMSYYLRYCNTVVNQQAQAIANQNQEVNQLNIAEQNLALAVAIGEGSVAEALQISEQSNINSQQAEVRAVIADSNPCCPESSNDTNEDINQSQNVSQQNVSQQSNSVAISIGGGEATVFQTTVQMNNNLQNASVSADKDNIQKQNNDHCKFTKRAQAGAEPDTMIIVDIVKGTQNLKVKVHKNGEVYLNGHKLDIVLQKSIHETSPSSDHSKKGGNKDD
ncbi:hypothetical protein [Desulfofalx alkaliphila]|uniref:hypothetical protein n=1 Tax=Desulfofalx alkaliphila TaxID=105483 RepID=UPI0004E10E1F|nr:hypothetical protein [Desulfofalx alkaliphila]